MPGRHGRIIRAIPLVLAACALGALSVQNATVAAFADSAPDTAAAFWSGHPNVEIALATRQIAASSGAGRPISPQTFELLDRAARKAPLHPQPFIVAGIRAQLAGRTADAERAFEAARLRDPRSLPARYFLATSKLQRGDIEGLRDVAALTRLEPGSGAALVPYLGEVARQPSARAGIREMFRNSPHIERAVLSSLASDPANVKLVLSLGGTLDPAKGPWLKTAIDTLVAKKRYREGQALWERISGARKTGIFDPGFRDPKPLPPFNWELTSSSLGLAERRSGGLHVMHYGQDSGTLARQLMLLAPGQYRLHAPASGPDASGSLYWAVRCDSAAGEITRAAAGQGGFSFTVPPGCDAQWLELNGRASDFGRASEVSIGALNLTRGGAQ